jgi:hypothetical protein
MCLNLEQCIKACHASLVLRQPEQCLKHRRQERLEVFSQKKTSAFSLFWEENSAGLDFYSDELVKCYSPLAPGSASALTLHGIHAIRSERVVPSVAVSIPKSSSSLSAEVVEII